MKLQILSAVCGDILIAQRCCVQNECLFLIAGIPITIKIGLPINLIINLLPSQFIVLQRQDTTRDDMM